MEKSEKVKYEQTIWLLNYDLSNWRKSYNVDTILKMREEIKELKKENERLSKKINELTRHDK